MQVTKTVRLSGGAQTIEEAVSTVLARAAVTTRGITSFQIVEVGGAVDDAGVPSQFHVTLDVTFVVKDTTTGH